MNVPVYLVPLYLKNLTTNFAQILRVSQVLYEVAPVKFHEIPFTNKKFLLIDLIFITSVPKCPYVRKCPFV